MQGIPKMMEIVRGGINRVQKAAPVANVKSMDEFWRGSKKRMSKVGETQP